MRARAHTHTRICIYFSNVRQWSSGSSLKKVYLATWSLCVYKQCYKMASSGLHASLPIHLLFLYLLFLSYLSKSVYASVEAIIVEGGTFSFSYSIDLFCTLYPSTRAFLNNYFPDPFPLLIFFSRNTVHSPTLYYFGSLAPSHIHDCR